DVDGDIVTITSNTAPSHGTMSFFKSTGAFTYTPTANYVGPDSFTYTASDGKGGTDTATVTINVTGNRAPDAKDDSYTTAQNTTPTVYTANSTLKNHVDPDGDPLTITTYTNPVHGNLTFYKSSGAFVYTPTTNYAGPDSFTYTVS